MQRLHISQRPAPQGDDPVTTALLHRAQAGDQKALGELTEKYHQPLLTMVSRMVQHPELAADIYQQACLKVVKFLHTFDGQYKFSTWFYRVVRNEALNELRRRNRSSDVSIDDVAELLVDERWNPTLDRHMLELQAALSTAFTLVPELQRQLIILQHNENLSYSEIAEVMDLPIGTVKSRIFRGHEHVRRYLRQHCPHLLTLFGISEENRA